MGARRLRRAGAGGRGRADARRSTRSRPRGRRRAPASRSGDFPGVVVRVMQGDEMVRRIGVAPLLGRWSADLARCRTATYTVAAEQGDVAGNVTRTPARTLVVATARRRRRPRFTDGDRVRDARRRPPRRSRRCRPRPRRVPSRCSRSPSRVSASRPSQEGTRRAHVLLDRLRGDRHGARRQEGRRAPQAARRRRPSGSSFPARPGAPAGYAHLTSPGAKPVSVVYSLGSLRVVGGDVVEHLLDDLLGGACRCSGTPRASREPSSSWRRSSASRCRAAATRRRA